jgi:TldD protein
MGCTFLSPGGSPPPQVIGDVEDGIFVRRMQTGGLDTRTGRALFNVSEADRILAGTLREPLLPFLLLVDGPHALRRLDSVGNDLSFDVCVGTCHRAAQPLAVSVGAPTFCIGDSCVIV